MRGFRFLSLCDPREKNSAACEKNILAPRVVFSVFELVAFTVKFL